MKTEKNLKKNPHVRKEIDILFEDENICVINKPSGLLSVPYPGSKAKTAQHVLEEIMRKNGTFSSKHRPFSVHRLDKETSGVMMFALTENAQKIIMDTWHQMVTERLYRALAENPRNVHALLPLQGIIDSPLAFNANNIGFVPKEGDEKHFKTVNARTNFRTILRGKTHTLFELSLDTGKKNQIRAHLASKGYPLAGDENYRAKTDPFARLCLHARTLEFVHPFTQQKLRFEVEEDSEWKKYVEKGDLHPKIPSWASQAVQKSSGTHFKGAGHNFQTFDDEKIDLGAKRLSAKDKAHMNFIEQGKRRR